MPKRSKAGLSSSDDQLSTTPTPTDRERGSVSPTPTDTDGPSPDRVSLALSQYAEKRKATEVAKLIAEGKPVYTPEDVTRLTGIPAVATWTQGEMSRLVDLGRVITPIMELRKQAFAINAKYIAPGRKAVKALMRDVYANYLLAEAETNRSKVYETLRGGLKATGVTTHRDTPAASLIVKCVFPEFDAKQVHLYSRSMEYAASQKIAPAAYPQFITDAGGYEKVRIAAVKAKSGGTDRAAARAEARAATADLLEFDREHPFLTVSVLSENQRHRLKWNDFTRVLVLAQVEADRIKFYAAVPQSEDVLATVEQAYFEAAGGDPETIRKQLASRQQWAASQQAQYGDGWLTHGDRLSDEFLAAESKGVVTRPRKAAPSD